MGGPSTPVDPEALLAHTGWVRRLAERLVRDPARVDDVVQQTWAAALERPPSHGGNLRAWLGQVVRNSARQGGRAEARRARREELAARPEALPSPEELVQQAELQRELVTAVLALEEPYRATVLLRYYHDRAPKEIAALEGVPAATVRSRLKRGLEQLRARLDERFDGDRRAWALALLPRTSSATSPAAPAATLSTATLGVVAMALKTKLALATALVALAAAGWLAWPAPSRVAPEPPVAAARTDLEELEPAEPAEALEGPAATDAGATQRTAAATTTEGAPPVVHGVVLDPVGAPIEGAVLALLDNAEGWQDRPPLATGTSDADGCFRIGAVADPEQRLLLLARAEGYASRQENPAVPGREIVLELPWAAAVFGRVTDAASGDPVPGAVVSTWSERATAGADGSYRLQGIEVGRELPLTVTAEGFAEGTQQILLREPRDTRLDVALHQGVAITLEVVDAESGSPLAGAGLHRYPRMDEPFALTDGAGSVALRVADGSELRVQVRAEGYCSFEWSWDVAGARELAVRIPMLGLARIEGTVSGPNGEPLKAYAFAKCGALPFRRLELQPDVSEACALPGTAGYEMDAGEGWTDEQGRLELGVPPSPEPYFLSVTDLEHIPAEVGPLQVDAAGSRVVVEVRLEQGAVIRGRAVCNGEPCARGSVRVQDAAGEMVANAVLDSEGEYELRGVPPGELRLGLRDRMGASPTEERSLTAEAGQEYRLDFVWEAETATIAGRVRDQSGAPLADVRIAAYSTDREDRHHASATSDADGRYALETRPGLSYDVSARNGPVSERRQDVRAGEQDVDFELPRTGKLLLQLVDAGSREPIGTLGDDHWALGWRTSGDEGYQTLMDAGLDLEGRLQLALPVGRVDLILRLSQVGYVPREVLGVPVTEEGGEPVTLELERGPSATLTFEPGPGLDRDAAREALVFMLAESERDLLRGPFPNQDVPGTWRINGVCVWVGEPGLANRRVDVDGAQAARLGGLSPGRYELRSFPDVFVFEPASFTVGEEDVALTVRWRRR